MPQTDWVEVGAAWIRAQEERKRREREDARRAGRARLPELASALRARGASRVVLIGSMRLGAHPLPDSDIDLLVFAMERPAISEARTACERIAGRRVDLIRAEDVDPDWMALHERFGEDLSRG